MIKHWIAQGCFSSSVKKKKKKNNSEEHLANSVLFPGELNQLL